MPKNKIDKWFRFGGKNTIKRWDLIEYLAQESYRYEKMARSVYTAGDSFMAARMNGRMCAYDDLIAELKEQQQTHLDLGRCKKCKKVVFFDELGCPKCTK